MRVIVALSMIVRGTTRVARWLTLLLLATAFALPIGTFFRTVGVRASYWPQSYSVQPGTSTAVIVSRGSVWIHGTRLLEEPEEFDEATIANWDASGERAEPWQGWRIEPRFERPWPPVGTMSDVKTAIVGFDLKTGRRTYSSTGTNSLNEANWDLRFPAWVSASACLALAWLALRPEIRAYRQRMRLRRGLCANCGYDLRGNVDNGRCPECGWK